ncbi:carbohydrate kinase [Kitasatospora sp. NBC_00315]|uniref:carbohydrate kinase family protein n=1 Tax=Kitasatospora sp. NBC_00315 TaxID=2975963 RepID=UPI0032504291
MNPPPAEILVIGESVADIVRAAGRPDVAHPGGSPANVAHGLARLGRPVALLTQLGNDPYGALIRDHLDHAGVRLLTDGQRGAVRTPSARVDLDRDGKASYTFNIAWTLSAPASTDLAVPPGHVHFGSIAAVAAPGAESTLALVQALRQRATISYDPNIRPALMGESREALPQVERCVALSDVVKASDEDIAWLYPDEPEITVAARWLSLGACLVLITRGSAGATAYSASHTVLVPARRTTVVDTVGAGDAFMSATLHTLQTLAPSRDAIASLTAPDMTSVLRHAGTAASLTVSRAGANPPTAHELAAGSGEEAIPATPIPAPGR